MDSVGDPYDERRSEGEREFRRFVHRRIGARNRMSLFPFLKSLEFEDGDDARDKIVIRYGFDDGDAIPLLFDGVGDEDDFLNAVRQERKRVVERFGERVLYLPTYRRVEAALDSLLTQDGRNGSARRGRAEHDLSFENGIIHFGMTDVADAISAKTEHLKSFSLQEQIELTQGYLHSVLRSEYLEVEPAELANISEDQISAVLMRIDSSTLSEDEKRQVTKIVLDARGSETSGKDLSENQKIILHYFTRLQNFYRKLQHEEEQISEFCDMCNKYLRRKQIVYDKSTYSCRIELHDRPGDSHDGREPFEINLESLSSGEKQIVGLFSKLILEDVEDLFVIIDEPEISLSMDWQATLLPDVTRTRNYGSLVAATHSPFVFDNELRDYAHGLNEFMWEA